ncbi:unnamed protein product [Urochloa humidicola]
MREWRQQPSSAPKRASKGRRERARDRRRSRPQGIRVTGWLSWLPSCWLLLLPAALQLQRIRKNPGGVHAHATPARSAAVASFSAATRMPWRVIGNFELGTNPPKLSRKNAVKSCPGYFLLDVRVRLLVMSWCMRLVAGLCLQSPAGVRKEDSERNEAHRRPYCRKRGRSGVIVLLLVLLAFAVTAAEGSQDDHAKMPPPPGGSVRQQLSEQDLRSIHCYTADTIKYLETLVRRRREGAKRSREEAKEMDEEADKLQERIKVLRQTLQGCAKQDQPEEGESPGEGPDTTQKLKLKFNGSLDGNLSSLEVEIVALKHGHTCKGDWTEEDFNRQIIRRLDGKSIVNLDHGKASLDNIHFKESSHQVRFTLAARVSRSENIIGTTRVEEAFMDDYPFLVLTERSKVNKKSATPKLDDEVHCLKGIKKGGDYNKRLKDNGIHTVQEFLKSFNADPKNLRCQILNINSEKNQPWRNMVEHAWNCDLGNDGKLKSCMLQVEKIEVKLFFDVVHSLVGAEFGGSFVAKDGFSKDQKVIVDGQLKLAYQNLNDTFDHIMKDNRPVNIHASINAAGSRSIPISAENLGSASGIDCPDRPLPGTAGQSAPEPSRSDHCNEIANQGVGQNHIPEGDHNITDDDAGTFSVCDVPVVEVVNGVDRIYMLDLNQQGENHTLRGDTEWGEYALLASVMESDNSNPVLDCSSGWNFDLSTKPIFGQDQAAGNSASASGNERAPGAILGDANREATFQAPDPQSQPNTAPSFASTYQFEDPPLQGTTFAALQQSQSSTAGFGIHMESIRGPTSEQISTAYTAVNTQTIQDLRAMQMPSPQVEDPGFDYNGSSQQY